MLGLGRRNNQGEASVSCISEVSDDLKKDQKKKASFYARELALDPVAN